MALDITWKFSRLTVPSDDNSRKRIILNILYAQGIFYQFCSPRRLQWSSGFPVLITLVTLLMDLYGSCDSILPNMGQFNCFLGSEYDPSVPFVQLPEFVYYYSIVTIIMVVNLTCFSITGFCLIAHWLNIRNIQRR